jgi:hypothetical protein
MLPSVIDPQFVTDFENSVVSELLFYLGRRRKTEIDEKNQSALMPLSV